jgi:hypothetical protein
VSDRHRRPAASRTEVQGSAGTTGSRTGRPLGGSDRLVPSAFSTPILEPDIEDVKRALFLYIDEGARAGAFDDGSAAYADPWIASKLDGWLTQIEEEFRIRLDSANWIVGSRIENLSVASGVLGEAQDRLAELDAELDRLRVTLRGRQVEQILPAHRTGRGLAPIPTELILADPSSDVFVPESSRGAAPTPLPAIRAVDTDDLAHSALGR